MVNLVSASKSRDRQVENGTDLFIYLHQDPPVTEIKGGIFLARVLKKRKKGEERERKAREGPFPSLPPNPLSPFSLLHLNSTAA